MCLLIIGKKMPPRKLSHLFLSFSKKETQCAKTSSTLIGGSKGLVISGDWLTSGVIKNFTPKSYVNFRNSLAFQGGMGSLNELKWALRNFLEQLSTPRMKQNLTHSVWDSIRYYFTPRGWTDWFTSLFLTPVALTSHCGLVLEVLRSTCFFWGL